MKFVFFRFASVITRRCVPRCLLGRPTELALFTELRNATRMLVPDGPDHHGFEKKKKTGNKLKIEIKFTIPNLHPTLAHTNTHRPTRLQPAPVTFQHKYRTQFFQHTHTNTHKKAGQSVSVGIIQATRAAVRTLAACRRWRPAAQATGFYRNTCGNK